MIVKLVSIKKNLFPSCCQKLATQSSVFVAESNLEGYRIFSFCYHDN